MHREELYNTAYFFFPLTRLRQQNSARLGLCYFSCPFGNGWPSMCPWGSLRERFLILNVRLPESTAIQEIFFGSEYNKQFLGAVGDVIYSSRKDSTRQSQDDFKQATYFQRHT